MKILILASPRSGSTNLLKALAQSYKLKSIHEPFNDDYQNGLIESKIPRVDYDLKNHKDVPKNVVIKCIPYFHHWLNEENKRWKNMTFKQFVNQYYNSTYEKRRHIFFKEYVACFDKVILLLRKDIGEQLKSLLIAEVRREQSKDKNDIHYFESPYRDFDPLFNEHAVFVTRFLYDCIKLIEKISAEIETPILYYEDLFTSDKTLFRKTNKFFDLGITKEIWKNYIDPKKRYRQKN